MKKTLVAASLAIAATSVLADGWRFAPILTDKNFKLDPTLALTANRVDPKDADSDSMTGVGLDFNFNCGILQDPQNRMRTHINIHRADKTVDSVEIKATAFELSPRYTVPLGDGFSAGVGPSLGLFKVKIDGLGVTDPLDETYFGLGLAAGVNFRSGAFYGGADVRYHVTSEKNGFDYDHMTAGLKVGMNF